MDFFDIGPGEILLILIVALIVWGPERLAEIGKTIGKTVHTFRKSASDLTTQVSKEIEEAKALAGPQDNEEKANTALKSNAAKDVKPQSNDTDGVQP